MASDVFSASLIVVEMVTGVCVYVHAGEKAETAAEVEAEPRAKATARAEAAAHAKAALASQATERLRAVLAFAQDSPLTLEAMQTLAQACTKDDPADRCSFRDVQQLCKPVGRQVGGGGGANAQANGACKLPDGIVVCSKLHVVMSLCLVVAIVGFGLVAMSCFWCSSGIAATASRVAGI